MDKNENKPAAAPLKYAPKANAANAFLGFLVAWVIAMTATQGGWRSMGVLLGLFFAAAAASGVVGMLSKDARGNPWQFILMCLVLATGFWFYFSGSYHSWRTLAWDIGGIAIGGLLGTAVMAIAFAIYERGRAEKTNVLTTSSEILPVCVMLMGWLAITLATLLRQDALPRDVKRFAGIGPETSIVAQHALRWKPLRVGLALSGGGYRAAVYHAGTLHALETLGVRVNVLSTVSGGSIIGAYYSLGGDPAAFKNAVADGRFNLKRELSLLHNAARLPFPLTAPILDVKLFPWYEFSRRDVQAGLLRRTLFVDDDSWRAPAPDQPALVIATTDLTFGQQIGLMPDGAVVISTDRTAEGYRGEAWRPSRDFSLAERVAMSGGFPLAFPAEPVEVTVKSLRGAGAGKRPLLLADGGIVDNSGFMMLREVDRFASEHASHARMASDVFMVSDAGAIFGVEPELGGLAQVIRATDVSGAMSRTRSTADYAKPRIDFSAQDHFIPTVTQFRMFNGVTRQFDGDAGIDMSFNPAMYPQRVLEEIARLMPAKAREKGLAAAGRFQVATGVLDMDMDRVEFGKTLSDLDADKPCAPLAASPGLCDADELRRLVKAGTAEMLTQFRAASTLDDLPSQARVDALYALGQVLVYLQWPQLQSQMDAAAAERNMSVTTSDSVSTPQGGSLDIHTQHYRRAAARVGQPLGGVWTPTGGAWTGGSVDGRGERGHPEWLSKTGILSCVERLNSNS